MDLSGRPRMGLLEYLTAQDELVGDGDGSGFHESVTPPGVGAPPQGGRTTLLVNSIHTGLCPPII